MEHCYLTYSITPFFNRVWRKHSGRLVICLVTPTSSFLSETGVVNLHIHQVKGIKREDFYPRKLVATINLSWTGPRFTKRRQLNLPTPWHGTPASTSCVLTR